MKIRLIFYLFADRIGPDMLLTHWMLYFRPLARRFFKRRFYYFADNAEIRPGAYVLNTRTVSLGRNVVIRPNAYIAGEEVRNTKGKASIVIEDNALISPGVHIYPSNHRYDDPHRPILMQGRSDSQLVRIKSGAWIGANAIILPGVTVGRNAVVGAGTVVQRDLPDYAVAFGNPAKIVRYRGK